MLLVSDTKENDDTLHDLEWIRNRMSYWKQGIAKHARSGPKAHSGQYMTFWNDCGGFNNIRMAFEFMLIVGYLTKRTVVIPPAEGWYLIDGGPRARMDSGDYNGKSGYPDFFDFDHLELEVATMSTEQFVSEMKDTLGIDNKFAVDGYFEGGMREWRKYLNKLADERDTNMGWGPLANVLIWPSIEAVEQSQHRANEGFTAGRKKIGMLHMMVSRLMIILCSW